MKNTILLIVAIYQKTLSKLLLGLFGNGCRFDPTCSEYTKIAVERFGVSRGLQLSLKRIMQCHPFTRRSNIDPVPTQI